MRASEYDEDAEAGDESFTEAAGESAFEADEDTGEADEASDEASDEATDESLLFEAAGDAGEASDESDGEADEATDEEAVTMSASAQVRADAARNRQAKAQQIAADRLEFQRAANAQRIITDQIRSIQPGGRAKIYSVGSLRGAGVVRATLSNGRSAYMQFNPSLALSSEVNKLRSVVIVNEKRQATATATNSRAIASLAKLQATAVRKLTEQLVKSYKEVTTRIGEGDNRLRRLIIKEFGSSTGVLATHSRQMRSLLERERNWEIARGLLVVSAIFPAVAFAPPGGGLFTENNGIMAASVVLWGAIPEVTDRLFGRKSRFARGAATTMAYLAPFANLATVYFLLRHQQYERFVSDVTAFDQGKTMATIDLTKYIAEGSMDNFMTNSDQAAILAMTTDGSPLKVDSSVPTFDKAKKQMTLTFDSTSTGNVMWILDTLPSSKSA